MGTTYHNLGGGDLTVDWTGAALTNDNWSALASIQGYRGDGLSSTIPTDLQTVTANDAAPVTDVNVTATLPNNFATGGVTYFGSLADPTIALMGSGTADNPYLAIYLDATGRQNVTISFRARDLEDGVDNAVQQLIVQYRTSATGTWTNATGGYFADVTGGPSLFGPDTNISVTLGADANNAATLEVRIMTGNATGNDEWVGLDDIAVTSTTWPFSTGNDSFAAPANAANDTYDALAGFDLLDLSAYTSAITIDTVGQTASSADGGSDTISGFEFYILGSGNDIFSGSDADEVIRGGAGDDNIQGELGRDLMSGGDGNDTLSGGTGAANEMAGGAGDDNYIVSAAGDSVIEAAGEGADTVSTALASYVLKANVENLTYLGSGQFVGIGNALDNRITGGTERDTLSAGAGDDEIRGGTGAANQLIGGLGNDRYIITAAGDTVIEFASEGIDEVQTAMSFHILRPNVENLTFSATTNNVGRGNYLDNVMLGNGGNDILQGFGGADTYTGGSGRDIFLIDGSAVDTITDFESGIDDILLDATGFTITGTIKFVNGTAATTADSSFLYDSATGVVSYDPDGTGAAAAFAVVNLAAGTAMAINDISFYNFPVT
jgi:Ca2+-binding RTX toxin-like protein